MNVVNLGECRDLLRQWELVRAHIIRGGVKAWGLTIRSKDGEETIYLAGDYEHDPGQKLKASLRLSWELTQAADAKKRRAKVKDETAADSPGLPARLRRHT